MILMRISCAFFLLFSSIGFAQIESQQPSGGQIPGGNASLVPLDGSGTLGQTYTLTKCGLNYVTSSNKLGQRFSPPGVLQPATFPVSGLPNCAIIEKAFLYTDASGVGTAITASITDPNSVTQTFPMTLIGSCGDKCWGYAGTYSYRADVTSIISTNGNYVISGLPVSQPDDVDGATLFIIYSDPTLTYQGDIVIWDGCNVGIGSNNPSTMSPLTICATPTVANGFMIVADFQGVGAQVVVNGSAPFNIIDDWWNYVDQPTTLTTSTTSSTFAANGNGSDCFNFMMMGLYWQTTTCNVCTPASNQLNVTSNIVNATCGQSNGNATVTVTGGTPPYTYSWSPNTNTTNSATGLAGGTYYVTITDSTGCAVTTDTIFIAGSSPNASFTAANTSGCAPHCVNFSDATSPGCVSVTWNFGDNTTGTGSNPTHCYTTSGTFTVTMICQDASGCADTVIQTALVNIWPIPNAAFTISPSANIISPPSTPTQVCFTNSSTNATFFLWDFNDSGDDTSNAVSPCYTFPDTGMYCVSLVAANANGCIDTTIACVLIYPGIELIIPNIFTPNGDNLNDTFYIPSMGLKTLRVKIYNRWGAFINEWDGVNGGWNGKTKSGKDVSDGVYYFTLYAEGIDATIVDKAGWVHLIRNK